MRAPSERSANNPMQSVIFGSSNADSQQQPQGFYNAPPPQQGFGQQQAQDWSQGQPSGQMSGQMSGQASGQASGQMSGQMSDQMGAEMSGSMSRGRANESSRLMPRNISATLLGEGEADERPILEELGIDFGHIKAKTKIVLWPKRSMITPGSAMGNDDDFAGPLLFCLTLGTIMLFKGKVQFGAIYGVFVSGWLGIWAVLNLMSAKVSHDERCRDETHPAAARASSTAPGLAPPPASRRASTQRARTRLSSASASAPPPRSSRAAACYPPHPSPRATRLTRRRVLPASPVAACCPPRPSPRAVHLTSRLAHLTSALLQGIDIYRTASVIGYSLLPIVMLAALSIPVEMRGVAGAIFIPAAVLWCSNAASLFFVAALDADDRRWLLAYPVALFYTCFALITIF